MNTYTQRRLTLPFALGVIQRELLCAAAATPLGIVAAVMLAARAPGAVRRNR